MAHRTTRVRGSRSKFRFAVWGVAALLLGFAAIGSPTNTFASLGGDFASVQSDQTRLQGSLRTNPGATFTVHQIQSASGISVNEYVSPGGQVFAVTWSGPFHPDLRQVLGVYFDRYTQAVEAQRANRHGRGPLLIQQPGLVVEISGHPRAFRGKAYVPQMLPSGVRAEDIQ